MPTCESLISVGVDWLTASAEGTRRFEKFATVGERELLAERSRGNKMRPTSWEGYIGYACGSMFAGTHAGRMLLRMGSHVAYDNWQEVIEHASNVSRLDVQATIKYDPEQPRVAESVERQARRHLQRRGLNWTVEMRRNTRKGVTTHLGDRKSDVFMRVYNKHLESKSDDYAGCWRYEAECKRDHALQLSNHLLKSDRPNDLMLSFLSYRLKRFGIDRVQASLTPPSILKRAGSDSDAIKSLEWLSRQVKKRVQFLVEAGYQAEVLEVLGLSSSSSTVQTTDHTEGGAH